VNENQRKYLLFVPFVGVVGLLFWWMMSGEEEVQSKSAALSPPLEEVKSTDTKASREVAEDFLKAYLLYDGKQPLAHIEQAKPYMTDALYNEFSQSIQRPTLEVQAKEPVSFDNAQVIVNDNQIEWSFNVIEKVTDAQGKSRNEEWVYVLTLMKDNGWKVSEVNTHGTLE